MRPLTEAEVEILRRSAPGAPDDVLHVGLWHTCWELEERGLLAEVDDLHVQATPQGLLAVRVHDAYVAGLKVKP